MSASDMPDELWARVLELGAASAALGFRDLCCLAIASRRLRRLSLHPSLWSALLSRDFPSQSQPSSSSQQQQPDPKSLYRTKFERHKLRMAEARRRAVYEAEGRVVACRRRLTELEESMCAEGDRMKATAQELDSLERVSEGGELPAADLSADAAVRPCAPATEDLSQTVSLPLSALPPGRLLFGCSLLPPTLPPPSRPSTG
ncbi:hypothetical protein TRIUR3_05273 [Triticum urartu]|uniref:F-box domain-containing protein n=1 Tax=Triticum urartu TaxID=4572 RepID=M7ZYY3_TRIUA|nr:hypothetical protein TRIUR3_05273 [Triticum urartu]